ncbi:Protein spinster 2 [Liparis tanakae]|uniref:Protein spinster 2 n=1 Tax=Liparis tanakae TaxID=230148 RepID=A0A4Z2HFS3_9TELE|nr:Protein spinster 2 [Liparis tanakae]
MQRAGHQAQLSGLIEKAPPEAGGKSAQHPMSTCRMLMGVCEQHTGAELLIVDYLYYWGGHMKRNHPLAGMKGKDLATSAERFTAARVLLDIQRHYKVSDSGIGLLQTGAQLACLKGCRGSAWPGLACPGPSWFRLRLAPDPQATSSSHRPEECWVSGPWAARAGHVSAEGSCWAMIGTLLPVSLPVASCQRTSSTAQCPFFICSFMVAAPIFGYLGDRFNRKVILSCGIFFWSIVTLSSSFIGKESSVMETRSVVCPVIKPQHR